MVGESVRLRQVHSGLRHAGLGRGGALPMKQLQRSFVLLAMTAAFASFSSQASAQEDYTRALKRAQYMLNETIPTDDEFQSYAGSVQDYRSAVRSFLDHPNFYNVMLRYHERLFGTGLPTEYLDELQNENIDNKTNKFAKIACNRED